MIRIVISADFNYNAMKHKTITVDSMHPDKTATQHKPSSSVTLYTSSPLGSLRPLEGRDEIHPTHGDLV